LAQEGGARLDLCQRMVYRIGQGTGVRSAAVTWFTPMTGSQVTATFVALADQGTSSDGATLAYNAVGPGYFRTMETAIIEGREFEPRERSRDVCVLNQAAAASLFPRQSVVGRYVRTAPGLGTTRGGDRPSPAAAASRVVGRA